MTWGAWGGGVPGCPESSPSFPALPTPTWHCFTLGAPGPLGLHPLLLGPCRGSFHQLPLPLKPAPPGPVPLFPPSLRVRGGREALGCCWGGHVGRMFSPGSVSTSSRQEGGTAGEIGCTQQRTQRRESWPLPLLPGSLGSGKLPSRLPAPGPPGRGPQEPPNALGPGREGEALAPSPASRLHPSAPHHRPRHELSHPFHHCCLGSRWFPPWPTPARVGPGPGQGLTTPSLSLPKATMSLPSRCVPPPPLCLSCRPPRSSSSPVHPAASTRLQLTFLGLSLPPPSSHLLLTGMSRARGAPPPPPASLRTSSAL